MWQGERHYFKVKGSSQRHPLTYPPEEQFIPLLCKKRLLCLSVWQVLVFLIFISMCSWRFQCIYTKRQKFQRGKMSRWSQPELWSTHWLWTVLPSLALMSRAKSVKSSKNSVFEPQNHNFSFRCLLIENYLLNKILDSANPFPVLKATTTVKSCIRLKSQGITKIKTEIGNKEAKSQSFRTQGEHKLLYSVDLCMFAISQTI